MGFIGYYRRLIEGFSKLSYPITSLQKRGTRFNQTRKCQERFKKLKQLLTPTPILTIEDTHQDSVVYTNASTEGLQGVLLQDDYVIYSESRRLKYHENNYMMHDLELATIFHAIKMWQHYLTGKKFSIEFECKVGKMLGFPKKYDFEIKHIKCN